MRIVYLNPVGCVGGAERVLLSVMAAVRQTDPSIEIHLIAGSAGPLLGLAEELGVRTVLLPMPEVMARAGDSQHRGRSWFGKSLRLLSQAATMGAAAWRYARRLRHVLRELAPDLIHSNGIKTHLLIRLAGVGAVPVVWHIHDFYGDRPVVGRVLCWARKGVAGAISISEAVDRDVRAVLPGLPTKVIYNSIDVTVFSPAPANSELLDRLSGLSPATPQTIRVGLLATYARWKGQDVFLEAAARTLRSKLPFPVRFYIVGGPIYHTQGSQFTCDELRTLASRLGIEADVGFIDFQQDAAPVYRALDVVVHASTRPEPFGLTIIEAMACGRPVVVAKAGGAAELFTHGHDAVGVTPGDAGALASAIQELAADPQRRQQLAEYARCTVVQRFNRDRLGPQILDAYRCWAASAGKFKSDVTQYR